jgi:hypothetical protein
MAKKDYGRTASGEPITDELVEKLSANAEAGFDADEIIRRRGARSPADNQFSEAARSRADDDG